MQTQHFDLAVIGFGKAGKTLAWTLAAQGKNVALIEESQQMYGGTCINIGCVPTKALVHRAQESAGSEEEYSQALGFRTKLTGAMRAKNKELLTQHPTATLIDGRASFISNTELEVDTAEGKLLVTADNFVINTGAKPNLAPIAGAAESKRVYTSTEIQQLEPRPQHLAVIGAGPIGLEFASMFADFGSRVTVFNTGKSLLGNYDSDIAETASQILQEQGITLIHEASVTALEDTAEATQISYSQAGEQKQLEADAILLATGRKPATDGLGLENTDIKLTERGAIQVDEYLRTGVPHIFAAGDVNGGPQFTYISLDDFRIILDQLTGEGKRSTADRQAVPTTIFVNPPLSSVGLTEAQAAEQGLTYKVAAKPVAAIAAMPKAKILERPQGMMKVIIDAETDKILGAQLQVVESEELINLLALAIRHGITATELKNTIYTHPSVSEGLNEVLGAIR